MKMHKSMLPAATSDALAGELMKVYEQFGDVKVYDTEEVAGSQGKLHKRSETAENKALRLELMKTTLRHERQRVEAAKAEASKLGKAITSASGFDPYDLRAPSRHLVPWLSPLRESIPRVSRPGAGKTAHWKSIIANSNSYVRGGAGASPWVNEGQRAPQISLTTLAVSQNYVTIGKDGSVTYEAESSSEGFEEALATGHFFVMETLFVAEEDSIVGGNNSLKLGTCATPTGTTTGSGSFTGTFYAKVVELTYEGYRNYVLDNGFSSTTQLPNITTGITQQKVIITGDNKTMTVNTGCGQKSVASAAVSPSSSVSAKFSVAPATGAIAWAWYLGTANTDGALYLQAITTVPSLTITAAPGTTGQLCSALGSADYSVNDGTTGGGVGQVTAYDGIITQAFNNTTLNPQNAYVKNLSGAVLTTAGRGDVIEIDDMLVNMWNLYKVTVDEIYVNAQEMRNITNRVLNTTSAPLLRYEREGSDGEYDLVASGVISWYFNPYIPGGKKIAIMVHPTIPPGTILAIAKELPPYFKTSDTPAVMEILTRRDTYALEYARTSRTYDFGSYSENSGPAIYAPFCIGMITQVGNG